MPLLQSFLTPTNRSSRDFEATTSTDPESSYGRRTQSGISVSVNSSKAIATAYRAGNLITDSLSLMPFKQYHRENGRVFEVQENAVTRNIPYLMQVSPNDWGWTPFQLKKSFNEWLIYHGNGLIWAPPISQPQLFVLPTNRTRPCFDKDGGLWYEHRFASSEKPSYIPAVEVLHVMINPDETGTWGRGVITFARETFGRRMAANEAQSKLYKQGFMPAAYMKFDGTLDREMRERIRDAYEEAMSGVENAYRLAILDKKILEYKPVDMNLKDQQFLESISATDDDIALFFGIAGHMLNRGKEAYDSNAQKFEEFKALTLDPLAVPFEEAARLRWLPRSLQATDYYKFKREALLRMLPKERADMNSAKIQSGQLSPNEARAQDELNPYEGGDEYFINGGIQTVSSIVHANQQGAGTNAQQSTSTQAQGVNNA